VPLSKDVTVQWFRGGFNGTHLQSPDVIPLQVDNMSAGESAYYGGTAPYFRYNGYVNTLTYLFQYQDGLQDTTNIDPKTGMLTRYRIINDPESFTDGHYELVLDRVVGT
jgi:hypothetical protein